MDFRMYRDTVALGIWEQEPDTTGEDLLKILACIRHTTLPLGVPFSNACGDRS